MQPLSEHRYIDGYAPSRPMLSAGDYLVSGSQNLIQIGNASPIAFKGLDDLGKSGGRQMFNFSDTYASLNDASGTARGSIFMLAAGNTMGIIGTGDVYLTGGQLSGVSASSTLQLILRRSGGYSSANLYQAGLAQPSAPTAAIATSLGTGFSGKNKGVYSVKITRVRSATGAESNASLASATVSASAAGQSIRLTMPAIGSNGADRFGLYVTLAGFGSGGPFYWLQEISETSIEREHSDYVTNGTDVVTSATAAFTDADIGKHFTLSGGSTVPAGTTVLTVDSGTQITLSASVTGSASGQTGTLIAYKDGIDRSIELEWSDADVVGGDLAPYDNNPPPAGVFACQLGDVIGVIGCYADATGSTSGSAADPGNAIAVSLNNFPESFPADNLLFLPGPPVGVLERAADGYCFIAGNNYLAALTYTGAQPALDLQVIWNNTGIESPHNMTTIDGRPYVMTGTGLVRLGIDGQPEKDWTSDVQSDLMEMTPEDVVLGYDAHSKYFTVGHGDKILLYNVTTEKWWPPVDLPTLNIPVSGSAVSCVTVLGALYISVKDGSTFTLYQFNEGPGSQWIAVSNDVDAASSSYKTIQCAYASFQHDDATTNKTLTFRIYKRKARGIASLAKQWTYTVSQAGKQHAPIGKLNIINAESFYTYMSGISAGGDSGPVLFRTEGKHSGVRV